MKKLIPTVVTLSLLAACSGPMSKSELGYARPIGGSQVTANGTIYSSALTCMAEAAKAKSAIIPRIAVGAISDYTQKADEDGGKKITQGASLMAMSAFSKAGANLVERFDMSIPEAELKLANNKLIGDAGGDPRLNPNASKSPYRPIHAGMIEGSDFLLLGGITELNYNISSQGVNGFYNDSSIQGIKAAFQGKTYVMNVGMDLRLVDSKSLRVVNTVSLQKQILGREVSGGIFAFLWGKQIFDIGGGNRALEPIQWAVRSVIERSVLDMSSKIYKVEIDQCLDYAGSKYDYFSG
ncbi:holdfast anchoring protein HfaB [Maritalea sp.]|uniref:holdfast anchoring protein HfaB n=1 Tax=Maritalea sp. TaxID=2003361 RepID=UPI003EF569A6